MEFKQIQCFVAAAETLNFTTAAERMYLSQPSLSRHIQNLEDELGLQLFIRDRKHVTLTPSGPHLLPVAREICAASARFLVSAKNLLEGDRGFLKVGYQGSARVVLSPILDRFFKHYPNVQVSVEELGARQLIQHLSTGGLDLGIAYSLIREGSPYSGELLSRTIFVDQMALFLGKGALQGYIAGGQELRLRDFSRETFLQISRIENPSYFELLQTLYRQRNFYPANLMETNRLETLMTLVQLEHGVSLLPEKATLAYHPDACCVSLADIRVPMPIEAMWRPQNTNPCLALFRGFFPSGAHSRER